MTVIAVKPRVFHDYLIKIAADNYEAAVSSFKLTPSQSISTLKGGTRTSVWSDITAPTWVADMKFAQDWETAGSLSIYLLNNAGKTVSAEFSPLGSGPKFTVSLNLGSSDIGGDIDAWGETTVQHGVNGQPVFLPGVVTP